MNFNYTPADFYHTTPIEIRFRDLDPLHHVNNAVFNTYFEEARIRFIQEIPELARSMESGFSFILAHLDLQYIQPVLYHESLVVGSSLKSIGNSSVTGIQALFNADDELKAVAETTGVWYSIKNERPARLPALHQSEKYMMDNTDG